MQVRPKAMRPRGDLHRPPAPANVEQANVEQACAKSRGQVLLLQGPGRPPSPAHRLPIEGKIRYSFRYGQARSTRRSHPGPLETRA